MYPFDELLQSAIMSMNIQFIELVRSIYPAVEAEDKASAISIGLTILSLPFKILSISYHIIASIFTFRAIYFLFVGRLIDNVNFALKK